MAQALTKLKFTYGDYEKLPSDGKQYQILDGELFMTPAPFSKHQIVLARIYDCLKEFVRKNDLGEVYFAPFDIVFTDVDIVEPDLFFIAKENLSIIKEKNIQGAPDFIVEILSAGTEKLDRVHKRNLYEKFGVKEYWVVDIQSETVDVFYAKDGKYLSSVTFKKGDRLKSALFSPLRAEVHSFFK